METISRQSQSSEIKIEEIIDSFSRFAIRDIRVNVENTIAAFILASCLIDQLAAFRYGNTSMHGKNSQHYNDFVNEYLPNYTAMNLKHNLRGLLVHGYSISRYFSLQSIPIEQNTSIKTDVNHLNIYSFLQDLEIAFEAFSNDMRTRDDVKKKVIARYNFAPPLIQTGRTSWQYSEDAADYLVSYYTPLLVGKQMNSTSDLIINSVLKIKRDEIFIVICQSSFGNRDYQANIDMITQQHNLPYPTDVLKQANLY